MHAVHVQALDWCFCLFVFVVFHNGTLQETRNPPALLALPSFLHHGLGHNMLRPTLTLLRGSSQQQDLVRP